MYLCIINPGRTRPRAKISNIQYQTRWVLFTESIYHTTTNNPPASRFRDNKAGRKGGREVIGKRLEKNGKDHKVVKWLMADGYTLLFPCPKLHFYNQILQYFKSHGCPVWSEVRRGCLNVICIVAQCHHQAGPLECSQPWMNYQVTIASVYQLLRITSFSSSLTTLPVPEPLMQLDLDAGHRKQHKSLQVSLSRHRRITTQADVLPT